MLRHRGVKQGINNERVKEVIEKEMYDQDVLVAEGKPAVDGQDGKFQFYFRRELKRRPKVLENGAVDYKNMDLFETVKKDQLLAEYEPPTRGEFGFDITGQFLSPKKGKELLYYLSPSITVRSSSMIFGVPARKPSPYSTAIPPASRIISCAAA